MVPPAQPVKDFFEQDGEDILHDLTDATKSFLPFLEQHKRDVKNKLKQ